MSVLEGQEHGAGKRSQLRRDALQSLAVLPVAAAVLAVALSFAFKPVFTGTTVLMPPQQQQSLASSALSSLGALAGLAGAGGVKTQLDQYVALLQSVTVADRMAERFKLAEVYDEELKVDIRKEFWKNLKVMPGRRDGLIKIEVDDHDPQRAQAMALAMVEEFRRITSEIAVTEASQRRKFFEHHLTETRGALAKAQTALQASGVNVSALKAEPKAAAEGYAKIKAEYTSARVRLQALSANLTERAPEVAQAQAMVSVLKQQLDALEGQMSASETAAGSTSDYVSRYREFKYQESLFELFSKQFELARVDESREGGLIQVIDVAQLPERKSRPKRSYFALAGLALGLIVGVARFAVVRRGRARAAAGLPALAWWDWQRPEDA
jgi:uncharacterized protein involved in exopolysaccharide biosynthesis